MSALEEYNAWVERYRESADHHMADAMRDELLADARQWAESFKEAEKSIVELLAEVERLKEEVEAVLDHWEGVNDLWNEAEQRAEAAEARVAQADAKLEKLRAAEVSANRQDFWGNEGDADAIRRHAIRETLGLGLGDEIEQTWTLTDKLAAAEQRVRELESMLRLLAQDYREKWNIDLIITNDMVIDDLRAVLEVTLDADWKQAQTALDHERAQHAITRAERDELLAEVERHREQWKKWANRALSEKQRAEAAEAEVERLKQEIRHMNQANDDAAAEAWFGGEPH